MVTTRNSQGTKNLPYWMYFDPPTAIMFPDRKMLYVSYNDNSIEIYFSTPCPHDYTPNVVEVSFTPSFLHQDELPVRNGYRRNHIVASYNPKCMVLTIRHCKHIYLIKLPPIVREIYCGGRSLYVV